MSAPMFLADATTLRDSDRVRLDGDEGRHAAVVRRITVGERVDLSDGAGHLAECVVVQADRSGLLCEVLTRSDQAVPAPRLVVVQAIPKGDRGEVAVETLTEVGVDDVVPWAAARSMARWKGERGEKALRKWRGTAREAAKQSRRPWAPIVHEQAALDDVAGLVARASLAVVLHEDATRPLNELVVPSSGDVVVVVGPEGGLAPAELDALGAAGAQTVRLGPSVLRTSTAGTVAAGIVLARTARWS